MNQLRIRGQQIRQVDDLLSLNDIWQAAGSPANKDPRQWVRLPNVIQLLDTVTRMLNVGKSHILKATKGKGGGTLAHWQLAMTYAEYISPEFQVEVNETYRQVKAEEANPELTVDRAVLNFQKKGMGPEHAEQRVSGVVARKRLTRIAAEHGVHTPEGFQLLTNSSYGPLWGGGKAVVCQKLGIERTANPRDHMSITQLRALELAELLGGNKIEADGLNGDHQCAEACRIAAQNVARAINDTRNTAIQRAAL